MAFFRRVEEEFEARFEAVEGPAGIRGKTERKRYGDGEERLKVRVSGLDLPDGTTLSVVIDGAPWAEVSADGGAARIDVSASDGSIPHVSTGDVMEIRHGDRVLARGVYEPD